MSDAARQRIVQALDSSQRTPVNEVAKFQVAADAMRILYAARECLKRQEFRFPGAVDRSRRRLTGWFERTYARDELPLRALTHFPVSELSLRFEVEITVIDDQGTVCVAATVALTSWSVQFERDVRVELARESKWKVRHDVILPPGRPLAGAWSGRLLDYSGCATVEEVDDLIRPTGEVSVKSSVKVLPLGFYAWTPETLIRGHRDDDAYEVPDPPPLLFLSEYTNHGLMAYNGTLVVAPQNSGKTELIVRWALAANASGQSVFVVDVKGEMHRRLESDGLRGRVVLFTTDPDPTVQSHQLNLFDGLDCVTPHGRRRIGQLVEAMLPLTEAKDEEAREYWQLRAIWLTAMVNLLLLKDLFAKRQEADLGALYRLASDEDELLELLTILKIGFDDLKDRAPQPGLRFWVTQLLQIIDPANGGKRDPRYSYQHLMVGITTILAPFSEAGVLQARTRGHSDFRLEEMNLDSPVTFILAAREQDGEEARTILSMVIKRLEQILYDRRKLSQPRPVLLLLDETRRIRGFQPAEYITFARDAKAGVVLVYQSLNQIHDQERRTEILENVGTQIYLRSVTGETARQLIAMLPMRARPTFSSTHTDTPEGNSESLQTGQEQIPYFSTAELYRLPGGEHPALIYIKDHRDGKPFLVDMHRDRIAAAIRYPHPSPPTASSTRKWRY
jgi:hypothetical protein